MQRSWTFDAGISPEHLTATAYVAMVDKQLPSEKPFSRGREDTVTDLPVKQLEVYRF